MNGMQNGRGPEMAPFQIIFYKLEKTFDILLVSPYTK
jgi:hypothetical protein